MKYITTTARVSAFTVSALLASACGSDPGTVAEWLKKRDRPGSQQPDPATPTPQIPPPLTPGAPSTCPSDKLGGEMARYRLDERSGSQAADTYSNSGHVTSIANWVTGHRGNALSFDGKTAITVPANDRLNATGTSSAVSVAAWVYTDGKSTGAIINRNEIGTDFEHFGLGIDGLSPFFSIHSFRVMAPLNIKPGTWNLLSASYDGITARIFVNGKKENESDFGWPIAADNTPLIIGAEQGSDGALKNHFHGIIDDVSLYDRSLTETEMRALAGDCNPTPPVGTPPPILPFARYEFNEGNGSVAKDLYGNDAQISGPTTWGKGFLTFQGQTMATVPSNGALQRTGTTGSVSIGAWVRTSKSNASGTNAIVNRSEVGTSYDHFGLSLKDGHPSLTVHFFSVTSPSAMPENSWVHLVGTYDGVSAKIYANGIQMGSSDFGWTIAADSTALTIGGELDSGRPASLFFGDIDDVTLLDRALNAAEVKLLMDSRP